MVHWVPERISVSFVCRRPLLVSTTVVSRELDTMYVRVCVCACKLVCGYVSVILGLSVEVGESVYKDDSNLFLVASHV